MQWWGSRGSANSSQNSWDVLCPSLEQEAALALQFPWLAQESLSEAPNSPCSTKSTDNGLAGNNAGLQLPLPPVLQAQALQGTFLALCLNNVCLGVARKASVAGAVIYEVLLWAVTVSHTIHAVPSKDPLLLEIVWITSLSSL